MSLPRLFKPFQQAQSHYVQQSLVAWFHSELGREVIQQEQQLLEQLLPSMFGYYFLQTGVGEPQPLVHNSAIQHKLYISERPYQSGQYQCISSQLDELALATESIDVALLHHSLDFHGAPHRVLREISRVVIPGGKLVIIGFNPWSFWGIARFLLNQSRKVPWMGNFISPYRLSDWLKLLDFQVDGYESTAHAIPTANLRARRFFHWLAFLGKRIWRQNGGIYVLVATKQVSTLTPIKPRFRSVTDSLVNLPLPAIPKPSTRSSEP